MAELSSFPTQNSGPTGTLDSREVATHIGGLLIPHASNREAKSGFRPGPSDPGKVTATGTPDGFVHVAAFQLFLDNVRGSGFGTYFACLDAQKDINILSTPADPTNPRDDLVIAQQSDIFDSDANSDFVVKQVVGTPAASPVDPAVTGSTNYVTLARVRVNANATTITTGNITDLRTSGHAKSLVGGLYSVALGALLPVASLAQRDALTGLYDGFQVWRSDGGAFQVYDGNTWFTTDTAQNSYTPALTSSGGGAAVGNGTLVGDFMEFGKMVFFRAELVFGTTTTLGTGFTRISLPITATGATQNSTGISAVCVDNSAGEAGYRNAAGRLVSSTTIALITNSGGLTAAVPFTWTTGDQLSIAGVYLAA